MFTPAGALRLRGPSAVAAPSCRNRPGGPMPNLNDTQLVILSAAAQRNDHAVVLPKKLKGGAATKVINTLVAKGLVKEVRAKLDMPSWRRDDAESQSYALIATRAGLKAINIDGETTARSNEARATKVREKKAAPTPGTKAENDGAPREGSKLSVVIGMLEARTGATIDALVATTEWLPHTTRAALTGLRKRGYEIEKHRD